MFYSSLKKSNVCSIEKMLSSAELIFGVALFYTCFSSHLREFDLEYCKANTDFVKVVISQGQIV